MSRGNSVRYDYINRCIKCWCVKLIVYQEIFLFPLLENQMLNFFNEPRSKDGLTEGIKNYLHLHLKILEDVDGTHLFSVTFFQFKYKLLLKKKSYLPLQAVYQKQILIGYNCLFNALTPRAHPCDGYNHKLVARVKYQSAPLPFYALMDHIEIMLEQSHNNLRLEQN